MRTRDACAAVVVALAAAGWLWSQATVDAPPLERAAPVADERIEVDAAIATGASTSAQLDVVARADDRRTAADASIEVPPREEIRPETWIVVANGTQLPIASASVRCIDSLGLLSEPRVEAGAFEPIGTPPFLLEVAAPEHSTRWLVLKDSEPAFIDLWRAGSVEVLVVDEVGNALEGVRVTVASELTSSTELWFLSKAFGAKAKLTDLTSAVRNLARRNDGSAYDHFGPRAQLSVGPVSLRLSAATDAEGLVRLEGLPATVRFAVTTQLSNIIASKPSGERRPWGELSYWSTGSVELATDRTTHFELVRGGACSVTFDFVGRRPDASFGSETVVLLRKGETGADVPWVAADHVAAPQPKRKSGTPASTRSCYRGLQPGEYALVAHWRRNCVDAHLSQLDSETCIVERVFRLDEKQQLDMGLLDADPGVIDLELVLVDGSGAPIDSERCFPVSADTEVGSIDDYVLFFDVVAHVPLTVSPVDFRALGAFRRGKSTTRERIRGATQGLPVVRIEPNSSIGLVGEPGALWRPVGVSEHPLPLQRDLSQRLTIELMALREVSIELQHSRPPDSVRPEPAREALTLRRANDGKRWALECKWTEEAPARLVASGPLPLGTWSFESPLVYAREVVAPPAYTFTSCFGSARASIDFVATTAEWFWIGDTIDVTENGSETFAVEAAPAAAIRFRPSDANVLAKVSEERDDDRVPKSWGMLEVADEHGAWTPADLVDSNAVDVVDGSVLVVHGLPPQRRVRLAALDIEFRTGPPGSTVEIGVPAVVPTEGASEAAADGR